MSAKTQFYNITTEINGDKKCFPMFRETEPSLEEVRASDELAALVAPVMDIIDTCPDCGITLERDGEYLACPECEYTLDPRCSETAHVPIDEGDAVVEGEVEEQVVPESVLSAREQVTAENTVIYGPFSTPDPHLSKTYRVRRPDCNHSVVIVQAMSKGDARRLVRDMFGTCVNNGEQVTQMLPTSGTNRVLYPLL